MSQDLIRTEGTFVDIKAVDRETFLANLPREDCYVRGQCFVELFTEIAERTHAGTLLWSSSLNGLHDVYMCNLSSVEQPLYVLLHYRRTYEIKYTEPEHWFQIIDGSTIHSYRGDDWCREIRSLYATIQTVYLKSPSNLLDRQDEVETTARISKELEQR